VGRLSLRATDAAQFLELESPVENRALAGRQLAAREIAGGARLRELGNDGAKGMDLSLGLSQALGGSDEGRGGEMDRHGPDTTHKGGSGS
jgi:hypothetical protein